METLAFYSYKGGVGRSLLLANTARFLASLGKGVVALDFDFEAPGLHYKLGHVAYRGNRLEGGAVPYLVATARDATSPPPLEEHMIEVPVPPGSGGWLRLMPAGPAPDRSYWAALKQLGEQVRFDDPSGQGLMPLLDLRARIQEELKPDYLLIDARTGVTELGGLATTVLADTVVCMFVGNQESLDGTLMVAEALKAAPRLKGQRPIRVVPVLTRTTSRPPTEGSFAEGVKRLLDLGAEAASRANKKEPRLFELPHDTVHGTTDRIVAGERTASAFSPLYKSYLELFRELFPSSAQRAEEALSRLEAVASIKEELTKSHDRYGSGGLLAPWDASAIDEGVSYEGEGYGHPASRYADLVCRDDASRPLLAVEYLAESREAVEFWAKRTNVRCLVLLSRNQQGSMEREIYARRPNEYELHPTDRRWDLPLPKEFDLLLDVGDRSVERMIDALRRGHPEAAAWLVGEWQECVVVATGVEPFPPWRPLRARQILDGLATTEDPGLGVQILLQAAPGPGAPWHPKSRRRHGRKLMDDWGSGDELDRWVAKDLFAPLFWRLPVEAVARYSKERHYPGETPCLAGYRLLAQELMGLRYDPDRTALAESRALLAKRSDDGLGEDEDWEPVEWLHWSQRERNEHLRLSDEPAPALIWEELGREARGFHGTLEEAKTKLTDKARKQVTSAASLRRRLRERLDRHQLVTGGLLGQYDTAGRIELYPSVIVATAELLSVAPRFLKSVVFIHFAVLALAHQARDLDGQPGYGFAPTPLQPPYFRESPVHVGLAQCFAHRLIERLDDPNLMAAFEKLSQHQPEPYRQWEAMRKVPLEQLRVYLMRARASAAAIGLPHSADLE